MVSFVEREMTSAEYELVKLGFDTNLIDNGNPVETSERIGFVAIEEGVFIGCSSGLAARNGNIYNGWFYLTDLYVDKPYRKKGYGKVLLNNLEDRISSLGIRSIWTWSAGNGAPEFYYYSAASVGDFDLQITTATS